MMLGAARPFTYQPALDGLRGLAVLMVMGSHFNVPGFNGGGLVGVTTFFVLSGYLITSLLLEERQAAGHIDLIGFYVRRAARLFPALALLLVVVGIALVVVEHRVDVAVTGVITSALYVSNLAVAANANLGPLEHTWSLAIEEQFYLIWPAALIALIRSKRIFVGVVLVAIAAAAAFRVGPIDDQGHLWWAYHHTATRIDAILVGCLLAFTAWRPSPAVTAAAIALLTLMLILPLAPGALIVFLLLPTSIAAAFVVAARPSFLAWPPLMYVGKISYGLYLWHFPIGNILPPVLALVATFAIAGASYRWLEQPIRRAARRASSGRSHPPLIPARLVSPVEATPVPWAGRGRDR